MGRKVAKISALSSKSHLDKYEYLTGEDLGYKQNVFEKAEYEYFPLGMSLSKAFKKDEVKSVAKRKSDFNYDSNHPCFEFSKRIDEFKDMSLGSKYTIMKNYNKRLFKFKNVKPRKSETWLKKERIIKNVEEVYRKYYDACKEEYDIGGELNGAENKTFDYKQFKIVDKTDKESKLDGETKNFTKEIKERRKGVDKKGFSRYFNHEPSSLVGKLLGQNTQDLKKGLGKIKQQKIWLSKDERNIRNNKNENDRLNTIMSVIDRIYQFLEYKFLSDKQLDQLNLSKYVGVRK